VTEIIVKVLINAVALFVAILIVPDIKLDFDPAWWNLLAVALIFALVNSYIRPVVKLLSFPISLMTLGAITFVINAALFLFVAWVTAQVGIDFKVGDFPPDITGNTLLAALLGSIVVSLVSTVLGFVNFGRKLVF
jgi:putative membrane protein